MKRVLSLFIAIVFILNTIPSMALNQLNRAGGEKNPVEIIIKKNSIVLTRPELNISQINNSITLTWNAVASAKSYTVWRAENPGKLQIIKKGITSASFKDKQPDLTKSYSYVVQAVNGSIVSQNSNTVVAEPGIKAPVLYGLRMSKEVKLSWTFNPDAVAYTLYKGESKDRLTKISTQSDLVYSDINLNANATYYYMVKAVDGNNIESRQSNIIEAKAFSQQVNQFNPEEDDDNNGIINEDELEKGTYLTSEEGVTKNNVLPSQQKQEEKPEKEMRSTKKHIVKNIDSIDKRASIEVYGDERLNEAILSVEDSEDEFLGRIEGAVGNALEISAEGTPIHSAIVTISYDDEQIEGIDEDELVVYWVDEENQKLVPLENIKIDKKSKTVSGTTRHFSTFILGSQMPVDLSMVDLVFTVDQSVSMDTTDPEYRRLDLIHRFLVAKDGGNNLGNLMPSGTPVAKNVRVGFVEFSDFASTKKALTSDQPALVGSLDYMRQTVGATNLAEAIWVTRQQFNYNKADPNSSRRRIAVLVTDAQDTMGNASPHLMSILQSIGEQNCNIVFNTVYLGNTDSELLMDIAQKTGGTYFRLDPSMGAEFISTQIELIYKKIAAQITLDKLTDPPPEFTKQLIAAVDKDGLRGIEYNEAAKLYTKANTNMLTGNYYTEETDLEIMNYNGPEFMLRRTYNSDSGDERTVIGNGWRLNYDTSLKPANNYAVVAAYGLNFRSQPNVGDNIISVLMRGAMIEYLEAVPQSGAAVWVKVKYNDQVGYVYNSYLYQLKDDICFTYSSGTRVIYQKLSASGTNVTYKSPSGISDVLKKSGDLYTLTKKDQTKYIYNSSGKLIEMRDRYDNIIFINYTGEKISYIRDSFDRRFSFEYDAANGMIKAITAPDGRRVQYVYDKDLNLIQFINPESELTSYSYYTDYNKAGELINSRIKSITDGNGHQVVRNDYDIFGRMIKQYDANNHVQYHIYQDVFLNSQGKEIVWNDGDVKLARYYINENGNMTRTEFDSSTFKPIKETDSYGREASYQYYLYNPDNSTWVDVTQPDSATYASLINKNSLSREAVIDKNGYRTVYEYDEHKNLVKVTDHDGKSTSMTYDDKNNLTDRYDKKNNHTQYIYDPSGIYLKKVIDAEGNETEYAYYSSGEATSVPGIIIYLKGLVKSIKEHMRDKAGVLRTDFEITAYKYEHGYNNKTHITDHLGNSTMLYYDKYGRIIEEKNPRGYSTYYAFDLMDRLLSETDQSNNSIKYTYDEVGNKTSVTDKLGSSTSYRYDNKNQLTRITDPLGYSVAYKYDPRGNLVEETNQKGGNTVNTYDDLDRLIMKTDPAGNSTRYEYDVDPQGKPDSKGYHNLKVTDALGNITIIDYDYLKRKISETQILKQQYYTTGATKAVTRYTYDLSDNIETITDPLGKVTKYTYDKLNRIIAVTDGFGLGGVLETVTRTEYDVLAAVQGNRSVVKVTDALSNSSSTYYDSVGNKLKAVDAKGFETIYTYDENGNILTASDARGNKTAYQYDTLDRLSKVYDPLNNFNQYEYDANGNKTAEVDRKGFRTEYKYDKNNRLVQVKDALLNIKAYTYDEFGKIKTETDQENNKKAYTYDLAGRLYFEMDAVGSAKYYEYDPLGRLRFESGWINRYIGVTTVYDELGRERKTIGSLGNTVEYTYDLAGNIKTKKDANGNTISYDYDNKYRLKSEMHPGDAKILQNSISYEYDVMGRLQSQQDSFGTIAVYAYDPLGQIEKTVVKSNDNSSIIETSKTYNGNGQVETEKDGNGIITHYTYNELNLLRTKTTDGKTTAYTYDKNGNIETESDWRANVYTYSYDKLNRLETKKNPFQKTIEAFTYYRNGMQKESIDALNNKTTFFYNANSKLVKTADPENNQKSISYDPDGNVISETDGRGSKTVYDYDFSGQLLSVSNPLGELTIYTYDNNGNKLTQTDGKGNKTSYKYNVRNLLHQRIDHGGTGMPSKTESYKYYENGLLKTKTDRNGVACTYIYDVFGRVRSEIAGEIQISYTYDNNGNVISMSDETGTTTRAYDSLNRVVRKTVPNIGTSIFEYDIISGVETGETAEKSTDPKGNITTKVYDRAGRLKTVVDGDISSSQKTYHEYYDNGLRRSITYPSGIKEEYQYYHDNTLWTLTNKKADGTALDEYSYTYDKANNQVGKSEKINNTNKGNTAYSYDLLNRLVIVREPNGRETKYSYDRAGNREQETVVYSGSITQKAYVYNEQNRLIQTVKKINSSIAETIVYGYDNNGNQLSTTVNGQSVLSNTYDKLNRLISSNSSGGTVTNKYNGAGQRVEKTSSSQITRFMYEYDKVVLEVDQNNNQKARNIYGQNLLVRIADSETLYYLYNGHADVTALVSTSGIIISTYYYDAFGNILEESGNRNNPFRYSGYQYDKETNLYYLNARFYDSKIARFLQEDTYRGESKDPLSLNVYTYCHNNPIMYIDPTGHSLTWSSFKEYLKIPFIKSSEERKKQFELINKEAYGSLTGPEMKIVDFYARLCGVSEPFRASVTNEERAAFNSNPASFTYNNLDKGIELYKEHYQYNILKSQFMEYLGLPLIEGGVNTGHYFEGFGKRIGEIGDSQGGLSAAWNFYSTWGSDISHGIKEDFMILSNPFTWVTYFDADNSFRSRALGAAQNFLLFKSSRFSVQQRSFVGSNNMLPAGSYGSNSLLPVPRGTTSLPAAGNYGYLMPSYSAGVGNEGTWNVLGNALPTNRRFATVMPRKFAEQLANGEGKLSGGMEAWITAADDLNGITTVEGAAKRLTLVDEVGNFRLQGDAVVEFEFKDTSGIASPYSRSNPGFINGGKTAGGAREWLIPSDTNIINIKIRYLEK